MHCALRTDFARRWALVELDVLAARTIDLTLEELQTIYRIQFPVLRQYEADTWYDQYGRIIFTCSKGLPGVGLTRAEWNAIKDMQSGTVTRTVIDNTLPTGPVERTIEYRAHFTGTDIGHEPFESGALDLAGTRTSEIIVDDLDLLESELTGLIGQTVLPPLALQVVSYLHW